MSGPISDEGVLLKLAQHMNNQVPSRRIRLSELLSMNEPHYVGRDDRQYSISKDELGLVKESIDVLGIDDIKLPIVLMTDSSQEHSMWRVEGEAECALISHLLGKAEPERRDRIFLYAPHLALLRRKVPTVTVCLFLP